MWNKFCLFCLLFLLVVQPLFVYAASEYILIISPQDKTEVDTLFPQISVSLSEEIDIRTVKIIIDGFDVTELAEISAAYLLYTPSIPLNDGNHQVTISAKDNAGDVIKPKTWTFSIKTTVTSYKPPPTIPIRIMGNLSIGSQNAWTNNGKADYYSVNLGTQIAVDLYTYGQMFDRTFSFWYLHNVNYVPYDQGCLDSYGTDLDFSIGYFYPYFSELTLDEMSSLGAKTVIRLGPWQNYVIGIRTRTPQEGESIGWGTFARYITAARSELILSDNLTSGFTYIYSWDDQNSIKSPGYATPIQGKTLAGHLVFKFTPELRIMSEYADAEYDDDVKDNNKPNKDNATLSTLIFQKNRINFQLGYRKIGTRFAPAGNSLITADRQGPETIIDYAFPKSVTVSAGYQYYENNVSSNNPVRKNYISRSLRMTTNFVKTPTISLSRRETKEYSDYRTNSLSLTFSYYISDITFSLSGSYTTTDTLTYRTTYASASGYLSCKLFGDSPVPTLSYSYYEGKNNLSPSTYDKTQVNGRIELLFNITKSHSLTLQYQQIINTDRITNTNTYREDIAGGKYNLRF